MQRKVQRNDMNAENFAYWLQGFFEMTEAQQLTPEQVKMIKTHLGYVFAQPIPASKARLPSALEDLPLGFLGGSPTVLTC